MTQAEREQENGKEREKEREKEKDKDQQRGVKRPIVPASIPESLQEVRCKAHLISRILSITFVKDTLPCFALPLLTKLVGLSATHWNNTRYRAALCFQLASIRKQHFVFLIRCNYMYIHLSKQWLTISLCFYIANTDQLCSRDSSWFKDTTDWESYGHSAGVGTSRHSSQTQAERPA